MKILIHFVFGSFKQDELFQEAKFIATIFIGFFGSIPCTHQGWLGTGLLSG